MSALTADIVNARIFDGREVLDADRVSIRDGVVTEIGTGAAGTGAGERIDAAGRLLTPGFVDAHAHPVFGGIERIGCDLSAAGDRSETLRLILGHLRRGEGWLRGGGWSMPHFPGGSPAAADLDALEEEAGTRRPILLISADHHSAWVNTRALELAGVTAQTPDPPGGVIERDAAGRPSGCLHESAMGLVERVAPPEDAETVRAGLLAGQRYLHSLGVTAWMDAIVGEYSGHPDASAAYREAARTGELTAEVVGSLWWPRDVEDVSAQVAELRRRRIAEGRYRTTSVKFMVDGIVESRTAALREPYQCPCAGSAPTTGTRYFTPEHLAAAFTALDRGGFDIHCHAIGDAAVADTLDAFAAASVREDARHHIAHLQVVDPRDVPRFAELDVAANLQALWACNDDAMVQLNAPLLGERRTGWQYPFRSLQRAGAALAMGSDWPVSTADPWQAIGVAVTRTRPDAPAEAPLLPGEALDLTTALRAYTSGSARLLRSRANGRIRPGVLANLALASADPYRLDPAELFGVANLLTVSHGRQVHRDGI